MVKVIAYTPKKNKIVAIQFESYKDCCQAYGIKHETQLVRLIENAGLAPDGRTTFDIPIKTGD